MSNQIYANMMEVSCKQAAGKSIACFPDVCFTPPQTPATPPGVPIPYPNTGMASDCTEGSTSVKISGQEVMLKNKSYFKKSTGDEAGSAPKKGVMTSKITGKVYFAAWSMDVKIEGENVVRHLDLTTHNHGSNSNTPPWPHTDAMVAAFNAGGKCENMEHLRLRQYDKSKGCGDSATGHHLIPGRCMREVSGISYSHDAAPVICVSRGNQHQGSHRACHAIFDPVELDHNTSNTPFTYAKARETAATSAKGAMDPERDLTAQEKACVEFQLDQYYKAAPPAGAGVKDSTVLDTTAKKGGNLVTGGSGPP